MLPITFQILKTLIFDLDGTLVESHPGIISAAQKAMASILPDRSLPDFSQFIGPPIREIFASALPDCSDQVIGELCAHYRAAYDNEDWRLTTLYPTVSRVLTLLHTRRCRMNIVTNKPLLPTRAILEYLKIEKYFELVICPGSFGTIYRSKVESVGHLIKSNRISREGLLLIGDSRDDAQAANENNIAFVDVTYGYGSDQSKMEFPKFASLSSFDDLPRVLLETNA